MAQFGDLQTLVAFGLGAICNPSEFAALGGNGGELGALSWWKIRLNDFNG